MDDLVWRKTGSPTTGVVVGVGRPTILRSTTEDGKTWYSNVNILMLIDRIKQDGSRKWEDLRTL